MVLDDFHVNVSKLKIEYDKLERIYKFTDFREFDFSKFIAAAAKKAEEEAAAKKKAEDEAAANRDGCG